MAIKLGKFTYVDTENIRVIGGTVEDLIKAYEKTYPACDLCECRPANGIIIARTGLRWCIPCLDQFSDRAQN